MSKVDQVKAEFAKKLADAEREDAITAKVPTGYRMIHMSSLFGTVGSIIYGDAHAHGKAISPTKAVELVHALPPVAMTSVRDGCLSFQAREHVESIPESKKERWSQESYVSPVLVQIEALHGAKAVLEWTTRIEGVGLLRVAVHLGDLWSLKIGSYTAKKTEFKGGFRYESARFAPNEALHVVRDDRGDPIAQLESPIRWASGGDEYPNNMTLCFVDLGADLDPADVGIAIVQHLAELGAPAARVEATS